MIFKSRTNIKCVVLQCFLAFLLFFSSAFVYAETKLEALYRYTKYDDLILAVQKGVTLGFDKEVSKNSNLPDEYVREFRNALDSSFSNEILRSGILKSLEVELSEEQIAHAVSWYRSPDGVRFASIEESNKPSNNPQAFQNYLSSFENNTIPEIRLQLFRDLVQQFDAVETFKSINAGAELGMMIGLSATLPVEQRPTMSDLEDYSRQNTSRALEALDAIMLPATAYVYQDLTNSELNSYVRAASSEKMQTYYAAIRKSLHHACRDAGLEFGDRLGSIVSRVLAEQSAD